MVTLGAVLAVPGVRALVVASQQELGDNHITFADFVSDPSNRPAVLANARRRGRDPLCKFCKAFVALEELQASLAGGMPANVPAPAVAANAIVPVPRLPPPPAVQPVIQNNNNNNMQGNAPIIPPQHNMPFVLPTSLQHAGRMALQWFLTSVVPTVRARLLSLLALCIFPQLVVFLVARAVRMTVFSAGVEVATAAQQASVLAANLVHDATEQFDSVFLPGGLNSTATYPDMSFSQSCFCMFTALLLGRQWR